jgi:FAD/FMN-containing dehydrogenase
MSVIPNGIVTTLLSPKKREQLKQINLTITKRVLQACQLRAISPANEVFFETFYCDAIAELNLYGVSKKCIYKLAKNYDVIFPWFLQYDKDKTLHNQRYIRFPLMIIYPHTTQEVQRFIKFAQKHEFTVSIRSGGHCWLPFSGENQLIINLSYLTISVESTRLTQDQLQIDLKNRRLHISPGVRLGVLYTELAKHGLVINGGTCPSVCVGGLVTGLGVGILIRKYGYLCDSLREFEIVLASGERIIANHHQHADLFRACRGGGNGSYGVITRLTFEVYYHPTGVIVESSWNLTDLAEVMTGWEKLVEEAPDDLSGSIITIGSGTETFGIFGVYVGSVDPVNTLTNLLETLFLSRLTTKPVSIEIKQVPFIDIATYEGLQVPRFPFTQLNSNYVFSPIKPAGITALANFMRTPPVDDLTQGIGALQMLSMGGYVNRVPTAETVAVARHGTISWFQTGTFWASQHLEDKMIDYANQMHQIIQPFVSNVHYPDYPETGLSLQAYYGQYMTFLEEVKSQYDPANFFHFSQSIPPA